MRGKILHRTSSETKANRLLCRTVEKTPRRVLRRDTERKRQTRGECAINLSCRLSSHDSASMDLANLAARHCDPFSFPSFHPYSHVML